MRIRGRRRDAGANPSIPIPIPPPYPDHHPPPPPSPVADGRPEPPDASPTAFRERIAAPSSPRSSPPPASSSPTHGFYEECDDADGGDRGRYAQLSEILKGCTGRSYRSSLVECKSETESSGFHSDAEPKNKLELLLAVCSNPDLLETPSDECKKVEICSCSEDNESKAVSERSKQGNSITKRGRRKRSRTSSGIEMRHQFSLKRPARRTNNCHWSSAEVNQLVDGVSTLGVGRWTELKSTYFETSIRTAQHLKDKWRNLLIACGLQVGRKKKVDAIRITDDLRDRIIALHKKHISTRKGTVDGRYGHSNVSRMS